MFNKLCKLHLLPCCGFYVAAIAAVFLGISILALTLDGSFPIPPFHFAPSIVFLTSGIFAWSKAQDTLIRKALRDDESMILMTIPFSEEDIVLSKIVVGSIGNFMVYFVLCGMMIYAICFSQSPEYLFTMMSVSLIDLGYDAMTAALSMGLIPVLILLEQVAGCSLLIWLVLQSTNSKLMTRCIPLMILLFSILQIGLNVLLLMKYPVLTAHVHPLLLTVGILVVLIALTVALYKACVKFLRYGYTA